MDLEKILADHQLWLSHKNSGSQADLSGTCLLGAYLPRVDLTYAILQEAHLRESYLCGSELIGTDMPGADMHGANLIGANLSHADLTGANLSYVDLTRANLSYADIVTISSKSITTQSRYALMRMTAYAT